MYCTAAAEIMWRWADDFCGGTGRSQGIIWAPPPAVVPFMGVQMIIYHITQFCTQRERVHNLTPAKISSDILVLSFPLKSEIRNSDFLFTHSFGVKF